MMQFSHVALNCADIDATERFYTRHFGFQRTRQIPLGDREIRFLKNGDVYLELFKAEGERPGGPLQGDGGGNQGVRHIAFQVDNVDATLAAMGDEATVSFGPMAFDAFIPGWYTAWVVDPDGTIVEISQGYRDPE